MGLFTKPVVVDRGTYEVTVQKPRYGMILAAIIGGLMLLGMIAGDNKNQNSPAASYSQSR